jgi:predicted transcriptional regulator
MARLQDLLAQHLEQRNLAARTFADRSGIPYPTLLGVLNKGTVPRKPEHREALRRELGIDAGAWAGILAASQRDGVEIPTEGPLTLQQLVLKHLLAQGHTEQSFAKATGIPYPTLMGVTRRCALPRADTLARLAETLRVPLEEMRAAADCSRSGRRDGSSEASDDSPLAEDAGSTQDGDAGLPTPSLAQLTAEAVALSGGSIAAWARQHGVPYLSLTRLITHGEPPRKQAALDPLRAALNLSPERFTACLARSRNHPEPAHVAKHNEQPVTPLQAALQAAVQERNLTLKAFSEAVDLSPLTASRLLKAGELPGRVTTHEKLRVFLGLGSDDYQGLLNRSRSASAGIQQLEAPPLPAQAAPAAPAALSDEGLLAAIRVLNPGQRDEVERLVRTLRGS